MPGSATCTTPGCTLVPAVATSFASGFGDPWLTLLGVISQPTARYNYDRTGTALPSGSPVTRTYATDEYEFYVQDSWRLRPNLTVTGGVRYNLYSPPWEVDGLQVAPSIPLGTWFEHAAAEHVEGHSRQRAAAAHARPRRTGEREDGLLRLGLQQLRSARGRGLDAARERRIPRLADRRRQDGRPRRVLAALRPRRVRARDHLRRRADRSACRRACRRRSAARTRPSRPRGSAISRRCRRRSPRRRRAGSRRHRRSATSRSTRASTDGITTPYHHVFNAVVGRDLPGNFALEAAYVGRRARNLLIRRDLAMPLDLVDPKSGVNYFQAAGQAIKAYQAAGVDELRRRRTSSASARSRTGRTCSPARRARCPVSPSPPRSGWRACSSRTIPTSARRSSTPTPPARRRAASTGGTRTSTASSPICAAQSSIANADYNSMQLTLRKRFSAGYQFDVNYTLSKSTDLGSAVERGTVGLGGYSGIPAEPVAARAPVLVLGLRRPPPVEPELGRRPAVRPRPARSAAACPPG